MLLYEGHIHEGRGAVRTTFGTKNNNNNNQQRETLVINAANANPGRAEQIVYGPVVVDISSNSDDGVMDYDDKPVPKEYNNNNNNKEWIKKRENVKDGEKELLLAIDLGLNCGASMFDDSGNLLRYEQLRFQNEEDLYQRAPELIESWVQDVNDVMKEKKEEKCCSLSYLVIEGGGHYLDAWEESLNNNNNNENDDVQLICIRPEEWRSYLLTDKEKESSRASKEAARLIARQIVFEHSSSSKKKHEGKFKTDCAESVSIGYYMASRLGWVKKDPLVNRYTNGKVIVPR